MLWMVFLRVCEICAGLGEDWCFWAWRVRVWFMGVIGGHIGVWPLRACL